ncbi:hypothetical protein GCM10027051_16470 [Niabella terrae]
MISMPAVISTYRILMKKAFNSDIDEDWAEWALEMMEAGYESGNLYILAGITKPYNQFELQELTDKVLADLNLQINDRLQTIRNYVYYIISKTINQPTSYLTTLGEIKDICIGLDMDSEYMSFYLLYFAKDDLNESENQWYWDGADRSNIDKIIYETFQKYMDKIDETKKTAAQ